MIVDPDNKDTWITKVRAGSNSNEIAISINQSVKSDCIIVWEFEKNCEVSSIDVGKNAKIFYDRLGNTFVTEEDHVLICSQDVRL